MTTSVHSTLTGSDLHEPKGVASALSGMVYVADGAGSGAWVSASSVVTNTAFSTGDLKPTHKSSADTGWILWSDGTFGDGSSGGTIRANADTSALFTLYWNSFTNTLCPVSGGRGVSAAADYAAHKTIQPPLGQGRALVLASSGGTQGVWTLGTGYGVATVTLTTSNLPAYTPSGSIVVTALSSGQAISAANGSVTFTASATGATNTYPSSQMGLVSFVGTAQGGTSTPFSVLQPTATVNVMIKL